jgi:cytochrome c553
MRTALLAALSVFGLVGCVGGIDETPPTSVPPGGTPTGTATNAKPLFDSDVYPIIKAKCASCHSAAGPVGNVTGFVGASTADGYQTAISYAALVSNFTASTAPILTKVAAGHNGQTYTPAETTSISGWLDEEVRLRNVAGTGTGSGGGSESPSDVSLRLLKQWSGCMNIADFKTAGMATAWGQMQANNGSKCASCHTSGAQGFMASADETLFFNTLSSNKFYMLQYFNTDGLTTPATAKMVINTASFLGVSNHQAPHLEHPAFDPTNNAGMQALQKFYDLTMARRTANDPTCATPKLTN